MVMSTMPIKYAVPAGSARTRLLTACAARYTGCTVRGWDVWDGLDTHPASQNSGRFGYSFGKTRTDSVHVFCERVGGGFGGKQEVLTEDICALATLKTGRPVKLEFTREEQFIASTTRHPMGVHIKVGARRDGQLTAIQMRVVSNTGAYGNHGGETL